MKDIFYVIKDEEKRVMNELNESLQEKGLYVEHLIYIHPGHFGFTVESDYTKVEMEVSTGKVSHPVLFPVVVENIEELFVHEKQYKTLDDVIEKLKEIHQKDHMILIRPRKLLFKGSE